MQQVIKEIEALIQKSQIALERLEEATKKNPKKNYNECIRNSIHKLAVLTQKILNNEEEILIFHYLNLKEVVEKEIQSLEIYLEKKHITLEFKGENLYAQVSKEALEHILINLLSNAIKYNKENGVIRVELFQKSDEAVLQVIDSGIGISEAYRNELFNKFSREKSDEEGSGLGLSIVKALVELHNGQIECFSELGAGTMIRVILPIVHKPNHMSDVKKLGDKLLSLSHELKTPIHVMKSALDLMCLDYYDNPEVLKQISKLKRYSTRILNRIQVMIDVQKIQENYLSFQFKTYNVVEVIENVIDIFPEGHFIFDPQEEEFYAKLDLTTIQQSLLLFMQLLVREDATQTWIFCLEKDTLSLFSYDENTSFTRLIKNEQFIHNAIDVLIVQFMKLVLKKHHIFAEVEELCVKVHFIPSDKNTGILLGEDNKKILQEQMKKYYSR